MIDSNKSIPKLRPAITVEQQEAKLKQVGELYEKQFLREMVKAMRSTIHDGGFVKPSQAELIFREQLDQEYVDKWGDKGGIGLADLIHQQLLEKYGAQLGLRPPISRPKGPLPLTEKDQLRPSQKNGTSLQFKISANQARDNSVTSPWSGEYLGSFQLGEFPDQQRILLKHDNGLKSLLAFQGSAISLNPGTQVKQGQILGQISLQAPEMLWKIDGVPSEAAIK